MLPADMQLPLKPQHHCKVDLSQRLRVVAFTACRYEQLSRICPDEEAYKLYFAQALYKVRTGTLLFAIFSGCLDTKQKLSFLHATAATLSAQRGKLCKVPCQQQRCRM
jgi:hypothetical protein